MPATSGPTSPRPFASYDPEWSCWKTYGPTSLSDSMPYSGRWPTSGMTRSGHAYGLPTPAPPIDVSDYSWLPTPTASEATGAGHAAQGGRNLRTEVTLLPTPTARDHKGTSPHLRREGAPNLDTAMLLLPTPVANEWKGASQPPGRMRNGRLRPLSDGRVSDLVTRGLIGAPTPPPSDDGNASCNETPPTQPSPASEKEPAAVSPPLSSSGSWVYPRATSSRSRA